MHLGSVNNYYQFYSGHKLLFGMTKQTIPVKRMCFIILAHLELNIYLPTLTALYH